MEQATILVVDDEPDVRETLDDYLVSCGYRVVQAASAQAALDVLETSAVDLVLTDVHMQGMSGVELCACIKGEPRWQLTPIVLLTAQADLESRVAGLAAGADDFFAKPVEFAELRTRVAVLLRGKDLLDQLEHSENVITTLGTTIEARDPYTAGHCQRLAQYATALGHALGVDAAMLKALWLGGFLHDLGKVAVPDRILLKPGGLNVDERSTIQIHPVVGAQMVESMRTLAGVRPLIRHHHERYDGSGYPDGLRGEAIPLGARIMAVVDVYDALHTERPYKAAMSPAQAVAILLRETEAGAWDPYIVTTFIGVLGTLGPKVVP